MQGWRAVGLVIVTLVGGCASAPPDDASNGLPAQPLGDPVPLELAVTLFGASWRISTLAWPVEGATSAFLLVHGHSGVKENYFHMAPERGASLGARFAATGRTTIALDLPGYGGSDGDPNAVTFDLMAEAVREVARLARAGEQGLAPHERVAAYGLSMGALIVILAASGSNALDAIVPTGFPVSPGTEEGRACLEDPECPEKELLHNGEFFVSNIDWEVANATIAGYETGEHDANGPGYVVWDGGCGVVAEVPACAGPRRSTLVAAEVTASVLALVGDHDLPWLGTDLSDEAAYFANAGAFDAWVVPDAGHFVHNHRTQSAIVERVDEWLGSVGT